VDKCCLSEKVHEKSWLVQLATGNKIRLHHWVRSCAIELNGMATSTHLNILPLGSYGFLLGIDWLFIHNTKVDLYDRAMECLDDDGERRIL